MAYVTIPPGKFKRVERIAQGSYGTVYKALWNKGLFKNNQEVAAKQVSKEDGQREVTFLSKLDHPNIVKFLGVVDDDVDFYIILELCDGGSLRSYLNAHRGHRLGGRFYDWAKQAGRPIAYLKTVGVTHKDVKSPNYLITHDYILKLCDFGLAKDMDATMTSATETASYPWMAPELLTDNILSPSYDTHAFGVVVWELWTTDIPFEDSQIPANLAWRICEKNERPPIPADCPKPIADLLRQCWEVDWKKRPSMDEVLLKLESAEHEMQKAFVTGPWELQSEFGHHYQDGCGSLEGAYGIATCPNGDIAVASHYGLRVCLYSNETVYKSTLYMDLKQGMGPAVKSSPWNVSVNADGVIYVTCNCYVLMYTAQGVYKDKCVAMSPDNKPSDTDESACVRGLTIDNNGQLLVGQVRRPRYISKHRQDGSHISSININMKPLFLAATSHDTIVISDYVSGKVQIVDNTGHVLQTLNTKHEVPFWCPKGVYCYNDIILVCNSNHLNSHEISCFSVSAKHLGSIPVGYSPWGVAMASDDNRKLLVSGKGRVIVYTNKESSS